MRRSGRVLAAAWLASLCCTGGPGKALAQEAPAPEGAAPLAGLAPGPTPEATPAPTPFPAEQQVSAGEVTVSASVPPEPVTVGDVIDWRVTIEAPESLAVAEPSLTADPAPVELRESFALIEESSSAGRVTRRFRARAVLFETGVQAMPAAEVEVRDASGPRRIPLPQVGVVVRSVLPASATPTLRGAKGMLRLPAWPGWWLVALAALVVAVLLLWYWRSRRPVVLAARPSEPDLPFDERALRELKQLAQAGLVAAGRHKDFHVRLSEILRGYLGARYGFDALEMTSDELNRELRERRAEGTARDLVRGLTDLADLVKFARQEPPPYESEQALANALRLVDITRPRPQTAPLVAPGAGKGSA